LREHREVWRGKGREAVVASPPPTISGIRATNASVRIEGHTDNVPIHTETYPSNWELSTARAVNVLRYFIEERGFPPEKLFAEGFADTRPRAANDTAERRAKNRRVNFVVLGYYI
jgi:chemotaxis protein MotB